MITKNKPVRTTLLGWPEITKWSQTVPQVASEVPIGFQVVMFFLDELTVQMNLKMKKMDAIEVRFPLPEDDFFLIFLLMLDL